MEFAIILICLTIFSLIFIYPRFLKIQRRRRALADFRHGRGFFSTWRYTPTEWEFAAQEYFKIHFRRGKTAQVSFAPQFIYISNGKKDILWELIDSDKYTKHLTNVYLFKDSPMNRIKFEVREKIITRDRDGNESEKCRLEEFYVPVPKDYENDSENVINFYQDILDKNAAAVAAVMPYGLGLISK